MSCGCIKRELAANRRTEHPLAQIWNMMRQRCENPNSPDYQHYGGRGITIDPRWLDFWAFASDMGTRPADTSLDRIDVNGPYTPSNCRWATREQQAQNSRRAIARQAKYRRHINVALADDAAASHWVAKGYSWDDALDIVLTRRLLRRMFPHSKRK